MPGNFTELVSEVRQQKNGGMSYRFFFRVLVFVRSAAENKAALPQAVKNAFFQEGMAAARKPQLKGNP